MNKSELISAMAAEGGLSKADSKRALDAFIASVTKSIKRQVIKSHWLALALFL